MDANVHFTVIEFWNILAIDQQGKPLDTLILNIVPCVVLALLPLRVFRNKY